ncbi:MAG: Crp/Fnr family transcriptional regulator [Gracilimonas sp.]
MSMLRKVYQHPTFTENDYQKIEDAHTKVSVKKNDHFLKAGEVCKTYYCLENGLARGYVTDQKGNEITTGFYGKHEIVIEVVSLFQQVPAKENLQAVTDSVCWKIDFERFQDIFHTIEAFPEWGRSWMAQNLFACKLRSISMITDSATDRYLALQKQYPEIIQQAPLKYIATYLGITDTSLSRIRRNLSKK